MRNFAQNMNWTVIIIETLVKNPVWWIHDYPNDIQERLLAGLRRRIRNVAFQDVWGKGHKETQGKGKDAF